MPGEKTEEPTDKHLRDAREQGQVAKSQEVATAAVVVAAFAMVWLGYGWFFEEIRALTLLAADCVAEPFADGLAAVSRAAGRVFLLAALGSAVLAALAGSVAHLAQTGLMFAWKAAAPKLDKLNPKQWFAKVFSKRNFFELIKSLLKTGIVCAVFYKVFLDALPLVMRLPGHSLDAADVLVGMVVAKAAMYSAAAFAAIAGVDWILQRKQFIDEHRMSKDDVKNEYKEMEGDPQIKGQRKQLHQELVMNDQVEAARKADVLVVNPTHLAIALEYKEGETPLPLVTAKGQGLQAERMIRAAREAGVPVMQNIPLAHDLWDHGEEFQYIPSELIEPVAEVLRWLRELKENPA